MNPQKTGLRVASILFAIFRSRSSDPIDQADSGAGGQSSDPDGSQLGGAHLCSCFLHLAMATGFDAFVTLKS